MAPACVTSPRRRGRRRAHSPTISAPRRPSPPKCSSAISNTQKGWSLAPRARLRRYLDIITGKLADDDFNRGCLIGDFSLEASGSSELLRARLADIFAAWRVPFANCIAEAQARGEIASDFDPGELADFLLASWQGAILRMKVDRNPKALERFKTIAFQTVFKEPS
jgi:TetR/AcrR family transcriptional repressor of nem operon